MVSKANWKSLTPDRLLGPNPRAVPTTGAAAADRAWPETRSSNVAI